MQPVSRYDIGARLVRLYAPLIAKALDENPNDIREHVRHKPTNAFAAGKNVIYRAGAWTCATLTTLGIGLVAIVIENEIFRKGQPGAPITSPIVLAAIITCGLTAVFHAVRFVIVWYLTEEQWATAGRLRRALVTPGNIDLAIAIFLIACGWALVAAAPPA